jgi:hypothetical protein
MMAVELLDQFELLISYGSAILAKLAYLITIPVLDSLVFTDRPEVVTILLEGNLHDRIVMGVDRSMTISEIHTPDLDVLVG